MYIQHFYLAKVYHNRNNIEFKYRPVLVLSEIRNTNMVKCLGVTSQIINSGPYLMNRIDCMCEKHSQIRLDKCYLIKSNNLIKDLGFCNSEDFAYILQRKEAFDKTKEKRLEEINICY